MRPVPEALVVVSLRLEELGEVRLAVDVVVQGGVVYQAGGMREEWDNKVPGEGEVRFIEVEDDSVCDITTVKKTLVIFCVYILWRPS